MNVLLISSNYPDVFHLWAPWNKRANLAISKINSVKIEVVAPRPLSLPFKFFPYSEMGKVPLVESAEEGIVHYPRFLYPLPKQIFYPFTGDFYRYSVSKYVLKNLEKQDLIHSHHVYPDAYGIISICKKWHIPLIVDIHGDAMFTTKLNQKVFRKKYIETLNFSSKIICISKNIYSLARKNKLDEGKLEIIPLGVDIDKFKPRNKEKIREEFEIKERIIALFVGQLIKRKDVGTLLKAVSKLDDVCRKEIKVVIIGSGPDANNLFYLINELDIADIVTLIGQVPEEELLKWYSIADIFVLPSLSEGRPTVINEAMASECAIVAADVSGIPEQIIDWIMLPINTFISIFPCNPSKTDNFITWVESNSIPSGSFKSPFFCKCGIIQRKMKRFPTGSPSSDMIRIPLWNIICHKCIYIVSNIFFINYWKLL